jgi:hypothetical protein
MPVLRMESDQERTKVLDTKIPKDPIFSAKIAIWRDSSYRGK